MAAEANNPYFRVGYNSLGAFATINHLHFQVRKGSPFGHCIFPATYRPLYISRNLPGPAGIIFSKSSGAMVCIWG
jgi:hypothetical protein